MRSTTLFRAKNRLTFSLVFLNMILICQSSYAQLNHVTDSVRIKNSFWNSKPVRVSVVPALLLAGSAATWGIRKDVRSFRNRYLPTFRYHYDDYLQYAPVVTVLGLNAAGEIGRAHV